MNFGRVDNLTNIDFNLHEDPERTQKFLSLPWEGRQKIYVGCPIWSCKGWIGSVYPPKTKPQDFLKHYAAKYETIELNSTFYAVPKTKQILNWTHQVPEAFRFCPKVTRTVTEKIGTTVSDDSWREYCWAIAHFGEKLGLCFAQFPENFGPQYQNLLQRWLAQKPSEMPLAVEFRHPAWFDKGKLIDSTIDLLYEHKVSTVITETPGRLDVRHLSLTQPRLLIRFNGHRLDRTDQQRLASWVERLSVWNAGGMDEIYFAVHQPEDELIPQTADMLIDLLAHN